LPKSKEPIKEKEQFNSLPELIKEKELQFQRFLVEAEEVKHVKHDQIHGVGIRNKKN
jgi:hypothetical protein